MIWQMLESFFYENRFLMLSMETSLLVIVAVTVEVIILRRKGMRNLRIGNRSGILWEKQSYLYICYLLTSFPLGLAYFIFLITGIAVGLGTMVIWVGIPLLICMWGVWWRLALFERYLAEHWLYVTLPPLGYESSEQVSLWQRLQNQVRNPMTWKTLTYLLLKFPLGMIFFTVTVVLFTLSILAFVFSIVIGVLGAPLFLLIIAAQDASHIQEHMQNYLFLAVTGFGGWILALKIIGYLVGFAGKLAQSMLGMSELAMSLEQARIQAEQEHRRAEQAEERRRQLVVNVSHELRTPIASIAAHLESLLIATEEGTTSPPPAMAYQYLSTAHQEAKRLGVLVDELLSLARMESNELQLNIQKVNARDAAEEVYHILQPLAHEERCVTLVRGYASNLPPVLADYQRLVQILLNLVRNAITYTPAGGIVSITLEKTDDNRHLAVTVEDNGIGIPTQDLQAIFERFYRVDDSRTRSTGGFGLGLAIVHDFVVAMGGTITAESKRGQGSRFCVRLPMAA